MFSSSAAPSRLLHLYPPANQKKKNKTPSVNILKQQFLFKNMHTHETQTEEVKKRLYIFQDLKICFKASTLLHIRHKIRPHKQPSSQETRGLPTMTRTQTKPKKHKSRHEQGALEGHEQEKPGP
jgi:hypothetical protein